MTPPTAKRIPTGHASQSKPSVRPEVRQSAGPPDKHDAARHFGAAHAVTPGDLTETTDELTEKCGFDGVFEIVGRSSTIRQAWDATRRGGTTVVVGAGAQDDHMRLSAGELYLSDQRRVGSLYGSGNIRTEIARLLPLWRTSHLDLRGLISRTITLDELRDAVAALEQGAAVRSLLTFS